VTRIAPAALPDDLPVHNNLIRATYSNPEMHRGFASLSGRVHSASHLPARIRELVVLTVVGQLGARYQWQQHIPAARRAGVTEDEIAALGRGDLGALTGADAAAVALASAVDRCAVDDAVWGEASTFYSALELSDLVLLAGFYGLAARYALALDVVLEIGADSSAEA
jgi:4-carboxymuconolactone decarboxylase